MLCPTKQNPAADHGTRGLTVSELAGDEMWWKGPNFLVLSGSNRPERKSSKPAEVFTLVKAERKQALEEQIAQTKESET